MRPQLGLFVCSLLLFVACSAPAPAMQPASTPAATPADTQVAPADTQATPQAATAAYPVDTRCALPAAPTIIRREGAAVLQSWDIPASDVLFQPALPDDPAYLAYRDAIRRDGAELRQPVADAPEPKDDQERALHELEAFNADIAYGGRAGRIRPVHCLDALLFAYQNNRYSQLDHPTEFIASILRKNVHGRPMLKVLFAAGEVMYPPKSLYGFDEVEKARAQGWAFWVMLHNHTVQHNGQKRALGAPTLSASDVQLVRNLAQDRGLGNAWVTNGVFTIEVPAGDFQKFRARE